jgi:hypothetical protein
MAESTDNDRILSLALDALKLERLKIDEEIMSIERLLSRRAPRSVQSAGKKKRHLSPAGRKAISDALKRRWAKFRVTRGKLGKKP